MVTPKSHVISVKIPIDSHSMTPMSMQRLRQTVGRDTRVIRAYLGVIEQHEKELLLPPRRLIVDQTRLDQLTMTTKRPKSGHEVRPVVPHDLRRKFPRISPNELANCRITAAALYDSYLALKRKNGREQSRPCVQSRRGRIPRWTFHHCFKLIEDKDSRPRWRIELRDAFDSVPQGRTIHDKLILPLKTSPYHVNQIRRGEVRALQVFTDRHRKWWATIVVRLPTQSTLQGKNSLSKAVLGIDLGIKKAICTTLLTQRKVSETRYFVQKDKAAAIMKYDRILAKIQSKKDIEKNAAQSRGELPQKLKSLRSKREDVAKEYDRALVRDLLGYIAELNRKYSLFIALGRVKGIRGRARRGNYQGPKFRGMIHSWSFSRITSTLSVGLAKMGYPVDGKNARYFTVSEQWTSKTCWKCGRRGYRPRQSLFVCSCGFRTNADRNASLNIASRLISSIPSLKDDANGLGRWVTPRKDPTPNAGRSASSKRTPTLPYKDKTSCLGKSAAVHLVQTDLLGSGDETEMSDNDPAVARTEETLSVSGTDVTGRRQENEARPEGGETLQ